MQGARVKPERFDPTYFHQPPAQMAPHVNGMPPRPTVSQTVRQTQPRPLGKQIMPVQEPENLESLPDFASIKGIFGWTTIDDVNVPYIFRHEKQHVSVRIVEMKLLSRYPNSYPDDLGKHQPLTSFFVTPNEAKLLNEINLVHCGGEYGQKEFTTKDLIVLLTDFEEFYSLVKKTFPENGLNSIDIKNEKDHRNIAGFCGWLQINNTVSPYVRRSSGKYVPLSVIQYAAGLLTGVQVEGSLPSTKECELLNKACTIAGFDFTFAESTRLINVAEIMRNVSVAVTELPLANPLQHAQYMELPNTNSTPKQSKSMDLRVNPPAGTNQPSAIPIADAGSHGFPLAPIPAAHQQHMDQTVMRQQLQAQQAMAARAAEDMRGKNVRIPPPHQYPGANMNPSALNIIPYSRYPNVSPFPQKNGAPAPGYFPRSGPPNVSVQAPGRGGVHAVAQMQAYYMQQAQHAQQTQQTQQQTMPTKNNSNGVPGGRAVRAHPRGYGSSASYQDRSKQSPINNVSQSPSPQRPPSGQRTFPGIPSSPNSNPPHQVSPRGMYGPVGGLPSEIPQGLQPGQNLYQPARQPGSSPSLQNPALDPLQSMACMLPPQVGVHRGGASAPNASQQHRTSPAYSANNTQRSNSTSPRQKSPHNLREGIPGLFTPPRQPVTPDRPPASKPPASIGAPPPLLMMAAPVIVPSPTQPDIVQSSQPLNQGNTAPDIQPVSQPQEEQVEPSVNEVPADGIIKGAWLNGKSISCLHLKKPGRQGMFCLVEAVCKLYFNGCSVSEFLFALENVLGVPLLMCTEKEEKAFIQYYSLPVSMLKCNKMIDFEDLEKYFPQLSYMFPDKTQETIGNPEAYSSELDPEQVPDGSSAISARTGEKRPSGLSPTGPPQKQSKLLETTVQRLMQRQDAKQMVGGDGSIIVLD